MSLPGLQNYRHDSEISDSEGESSPSHVSTGIVSSGLGIPSGHLKVHNTPPTLALPSVQSAPVISLVGYGNEEDESIIMDTHPDITNEINDQSFHGDNVMQSIEENNQFDREFYQNREPLFFSLNEIELPPENSGSCSPALQEKIQTHLQKKCQLGVSPYDVIIKGKSFRNPSIYEKLIQLCGIDEFGTNLDKNVFDPREWKKEEFYEKLAEAQKKAHENKMKSRGKIEFKSGTKVPSTTVPSTTVKTIEHSGSGGLLPIPTAAIQDSSKKRRSKWDNPLQEQKNSRGSSPASSSSNAAVGAQALVNARLIDKNLMKIFKS